MEVSASTKKTKKILITVSGLDGSGKSTFAKMIKSDYPHFKTIHLVNFRLINRILKNNKISREKKQKKNIERSWLSVINLILLCLDIFIFKLFLIVNNRSIICDRYFYDLIATHVHRYGSFRLEKAVKRIIPKADLSFFIDVNIYKAQKREKLDFHSIEYYKSLKDIYYNCIGQKHFIIIKNQNIKSSYRIINSKIIQLCNED